MDIYHVFNRGVEKRDVVISDDDRMRFVHSLYIFNDSNNAPNCISQPKQWQSNTNRKCIVRIHAWCLMNNHYHLLLSPVDGELKNISLFMKKLNMGYAKFFNEKYGRSGYLWQGKYKKVLISNDSQFEYIPYYLHLNPLDYTHDNWRTGTVRENEINEVMKQLRTYRWSSYLDYNNIKNFPSIIYSEFLTKVFNRTGFQNKQIRQIISGNSPVYSNIKNKLEK